MPGMSPRIKAKKGRFGAAGLAPVIFIDAPDDGEVVTGSPQSVTFVGRAIDDNLGSISHLINWVSNIDGALGTGGSITVVISSGTHKITANVSDGTNVFNTSITVIAA